MDILSTIGTVLFTSAATLLKDTLIEAVSKKTYLHGADLRGADLRGAYLYGADLHGAYLRGAYHEKKKVHNLRTFSSSLYPYIVMAVLFEDGEQWIRMGCLWKTLKGWNKVGIRKSNVDEFPDDGSDKCEDRAAMFGYAKACVVRMAKQKKASAK